MSKSSCRERNRGVLVDDDGANTRFRHFGDVVVDWSPDKHLRFVLNGDYGYEPVLGGGNVRWYGVDAIARVRFSDVFALSGRADVYWDPDGATLFTNRFTRVESGTVTFLLTPEARIWVFVDHRVDHATHAVFQRSLTGTTSIQMTSTFGVIVSTSRRPGF